jgi:hypothetical protein
MDRGSDDDIVGVPKLFVLKFALHKVRTDLPPSASCLLLFVECANEVLQAECTDDVQVLI